MNRGSNSNYSQKMKFTDCTVKSFSNVVAVAITIFVLTIPITTNAFQINGVGVARHQKSLNLKSRNKRLYDDASTSSSSHFHLSLRMTEDEEDMTNSNRNSSPLPFYINGSEEDGSNTNGAGTTTALVDVEAKDKTKKEKAIEDARALKILAEKARLEADKMDAILTLEKITKLERKLREKPEEQQDIRAQLTMLQKRLESPSSDTISNPSQNIFVEDKEISAEKGDLTSSSKTPSGVFELQDFDDFPPISEKELTERMDAFNRSPEVLRKMTAQAAGIEDDTDAEAIVKQMYEDEQRLIKKRELAKIGMLEPVSEESKKNALEGFEKLPAPIQDMIAKSVNLENANNATFVIETLAKENKLFEDENGVGGFEVDTEIFDLFQDAEFSETSRYVMSLLPDATRKADQTPTDEDIDVFFTKCLGRKTFNPVSKPERIPGGVIIRGDNKMKSSDEMVSAIQEKLEQQKDIAGKLEFFFIRDPTPIREDAMELDELFESPLLVVTGADVSPQTKQFVKPIVSLIGVASIAVFSLGAFSYNNNILERLTNSVNSGESDLAWLTDLANPLFFSIFFAQFAHEAAHQIVAIKDKFRAGFPTIVPSLQIGFEGSITPLLTPPKNFKSLFDFAIAGPLVGMFISLALMYVGLEQQVFMDPVAQSQLPSLPVELLRSSSLAGGLIEYLLGAGILLAPDPVSMIPLHPFAIAGFVGIITNALALLPLGNTDGGRISTALFGRSLSRTLNGFMLLLMVLLGVFGLDESNVFLLYALFCTFFQREAEIPCKNEVDTIDEVRGVIAILTAVLVTLALYPITI